MIKQVVEFKDGRFGRRKLTWGGWRFQDLNNRGEWRKPDSDYMERCCKGTLEQVVKVIDVGKRVSRKTINQTRVINALKGNK